MTSVRQTTEIEFSASRASPLTKLRLGQQTALPRESFLFRVKFWPNAFEWDTFEVLRVVRSLKNKLSPINQIPPEVLISMPNLWYTGYRVEGSFASTLLGLEVGVHIVFLFVDQLRLHSERGQDSRLPRAFKVLPHQLVAGE